MQISISKTASDRQKAILKEFPGLKQHFAKLIDEIGKKPESGTRELMANIAGRATPIRTMSAETEIFSGAAAYSKDLVAVYVCSEDFSKGRIVQFIF